MMCVYPVHVCVTGYAKTIHVLKSILLYKLRATLKNLGGLQQGKSPMTFQRFHILRIIYNKSQKITVMIWNLLCLKV